MSPFEVVLGITHLLARLPSSPRAFSPGHSALLSQRDGFPTSSNDEAGDATTINSPLSLVLWSVESPGKSLKSGIPAQMDCESLVIRDE